ncbi:MAG: hypothetical protein IKR81_18260 [Victivallales bacterium]|nr:hypothetical protein [Victivallales bacterium]
MKLKGERLAQVSFPVGGIGAGCIGIAGNGYLEQWEIFNEAGKFRHNGASHFLVRAESLDGQLVDVRVLNGDLPRDFAGEPRGTETMFNGFGWGPDADTFAALPHFKECELNGEFPVAEYTLSDPHFPGKVLLTTWSRFVPGESDTSSLPVAIFECEIRNDTASTLNYTMAGTLLNPWSNIEATNAIEHNGPLTQLRLCNNLPEDELGFGELALSTDEPVVSCQEMWYRGRWSDGLETYWRNITTPGPLAPRPFTPRGNYGRMSFGRSSGDLGTIAAHFTLEPGTSHVARFVISWYIPNRANTWNGNMDELLAKSGLRENRWKNYYASLCKNAADAARIAFEEMEETRTKVFAFRNAIHSSTLPAACLEGAAENLAVLISPTVLRLENGEIWGWEGVGPRKGSCPGSCQHVWNYAQAMSLLFPDLERTMREVTSKYGADEDGGLSIRLMLPLGIPWGAFHSCVDGVCGEVMKIYREWKVSGDTDWLRKLWPTAKKAVAYVWDERNPDRWDPDQSGILTGRQHHTLDIELFGPSGWLMGHYLAALKAATEMARICGDEAFGDLCDSIYRKGRKWCEEHLFNGEYFAQQVDVKDHRKFVSYANKYDSPNPDEQVARLEDYYWNSEVGEIKYQIGGGCEIDSHLGQLYASLYGIGEIWDARMNDSTLDAIFKYNYKPSMRDWANTWRVYALNDEAGTVMCTWPHAESKPAIPLGYNCEVMTGFEWAFGVHLALRGKLREAEAVASAIRGRYDGKKRNPWNEIECGNNYARALASYAMLQAFSGFRYDMSKKMIGFKPQGSGEFRCFWALGSAWGVFEVHDGVQKVQLLHGILELERLAIEGTALTVNDQAVGAEYANGEWRLEKPILLKPQDCLEVHC